MSKFAIAFDTSNEVVCVGLGKVSQASIEFIDESIVSANRCSNQLLLTLIDKLLKSNNVAKESLSVIGVGRGPGSFTGVRIAIATAKGLCFARSIPAVGISTLDCIAQNAYLSGYRGDLQVVADAMRKEIYPARYKITDLGIERKSADCVIKADKFFETFDRSVPLAGDGLVKFADLAGSATLLEESLWYPSGKSLLSLMPGMNFEDAGQLLPIYTRLSDAEEAEREKLKNNTARNLTSGVQGESSEVEIRPCRSDDAKKLASLESVNFSTDCWSDEQFSDDLRRDDRIWYKAVKGAEIVGYAGVLVSQGSADLLKVCVSESTRRQHIATDLLVQIFDDLRNLSIKQVHLEVRESNNPARCFYEKLGFEKIGKRSNYFGKEDAICYKLKIENFKNGQATFEKTEKNGQAFIKCQYKHPLIMAFESSCDETAGAIVDASGNILSSVISSSASFHARFGGVVPEIASRKHVEVISQVAEETLLTSGLALADIDAIAVTNRPGLVGSLVVGCAFAKAASWATDKPLIFVDHLEGHLYANKLAQGSIEFPAVASLISGGNTMLVKVNNWGDYEVLGGTIDDAVGEAYDKVAREFGLPYPGGPQISKLAEQGDASQIDLPRPLLHSHDLRMSLSGLKTAVILATEDVKKKNNGELSYQDMCNICASFEKSVSDVQVAKAKDACKKVGAKTFCFGGGVAANKNLRGEYLKMCEELRIHFIVSPLNLCGDNAAMIGLVAQDAYSAHNFAQITGDVSANGLLN